MSHLESQLLSTQQPALMAFFYCDFRHRESQDHLNVLGSLVAQICSQISHCPDELEIAFNHSRYSDKRPTAMLLRSILSFISTTRKVLLLIDAVDECNQRQELLSVMTHLQEQNKNISVLLTSRQELDIEDALVSFDHIRIEDWTKEVDDDIKTYIDQRLQADASLLRLKHSVRKEIRTGLHQRSLGM